MRATPRDHELRDKRLHDGTEIAKLAGNFCRMPQLAISLQVGNPESADQVIASGLADVHKWLKGVLKTQFKDDESQIAGVHQTQAKFYDTVRTQNVPKDGWQNSTSKNLLLRRQIDTDKHLSHM